MSGERPDLGARRGLGDVGLDRREFLADALLRVRGLGAGAVITLPVASTASDSALFSLFAADTDEPAALWSSARDNTTVGLGAALRLPVPGDGRLAGLDAAATTALAELVSVRHPAAPAAQPALLGGRAFMAGSACEAPWHGFGDGALTLPRWLYRRNADAAALSLIVRGDEDFARAARWLREADAILATCEAARGAGPAHDPGAAARVRRVRTLDRARWAQMVDAVKRGIARGEFAKVVLARRSLVQMQDAIDVRDVLDRLAARQVADGGYRFALRYEGRTFLGLSPELLVARRGSAVRSEALAGSIPRAADGADDRRRGLALLASVKDRAEHDFVVQTIRARLAPYCSTLRIDAAPDVRALTDIHHLSTSIDGALAAPASLMDLVDALHPTPSVGGQPTAAALAFIRAHEAEPRGWYAAPVGCQEASGDGEFAVAIRSALIEGSEAHVYAGAGIVRESVADAEYDETVAKERSLLAALGIPG